jgi:iron complex outermembrane receptor protein
MKKAILFLVIFISPFLLKAKFILEGHVKDKNSGDVLRGATVMLAGTPFGTYADKDGFYRIKSISERVKNYDIIVTLVGYESFKTSIDLTDSISHLDIELKSVFIKTDEIIVSANKRSQSVQEVPISMSVIDKSGIIDRGITKLDDALKYVPGVEVTQDNISIRGTSGFSFGVGTRIAVLLDGFNMVSGDNGDVKFDALPMFNIDRIEIIKGAGSALYGTSALGGVVSLITERPNDDANIKFRAFSGYYTQPRFEQWKYTDNMRLNSGLNGTYSQKFGKLGLIASASYLKDDSYRDYDDRYRWSAFNKLNFEVSDMTTINFMFSGASEDRTDFAYWNSLDSATFAPTNTNKQIRVISDKYGFFTDIQHIFDDANFMSFKNSVYYTTYSINISKSLKEYRQSDAYTYNSELQFNNKIANNLLFTSGINFINTQTISKTYGDTYQRIYAGYTQSEYSGLKDMIFTLGGRIDLEDAPNIESNIEFSPKFGISYKLLEFTTLRLSAGRGFRSPTVAERFSTVSFNGFEVMPNPLLKPESSWSYEIGGNTTFKITDEIFMIDLSVFNNELYDLIEPSFVSTTSNKIQFKNVTRARITGLELDVKSYLFKTIGIESSITFMNPSDVTTNQILNYRSEYLWYSSLRLPYERFEFQLDYRYKSKIKNVDRQLSIIVKDIDARVDLHIVDARISAFIYKKIKFTLSAKNMLDYYYTEMVGNLAPTRMIMLQIDSYF